MYIKIFKFRNNNDVFRSTVEAGTSKIIKNIPMREIYSNLINKFTNAVLSIHAEKHGAVANIDRNPQIETNLSTENDTPYITYTLKFYDISAADITSDALIDKMKN